MIHCPDNWIPYGTHCYFFNTDEVNAFLTAHTQCEAHDAWLAQVETEIESTFILFYMDTQLGCTDHSELWIDLSSPPGSKLFSTDLIE